jgi:hypothetical protein
MLCASEQTRKFFCNASVRAWKFKLSVWRRQKKGQRAKFTHTAWYRIAAKGHAKRESSLACLGGARAGLIHNRAIRIYSPRTQSRLSESCVSIPRNCHCHGLEMRPGRHPARASEESAPFMVPVEPLSELTSEATPEPRYSGNPTFAAAFRPQFCCIQSSTKETGGARRQSSR